MYWWLAITAFIAAALAYGYWDHVSQSRHLTKLFSQLAERYRGEVKRASLLALPQLRFEMDGPILLYKIVLKCSLAPTRAARMPGSIAECPESGTTT